MSKQLNFMLPEIDREKTKEAVQTALDKYRFFIETAPEEYLPKITASYSLTPPAHSNQFHSSTESMAIDRVDFERERNDYIENMRKAVNRLNFKEREAIVKKYFGEEELFDYEVYNSLGMGETYYYQKFKPRIFYKLAFLLKIEVYKSRSSEKE